MGPVTTGSSLAGLLAEYDIGTVRDGRWLAGGMFQKPVLVTVAEYLRGYQEGAATPLLPAEHRAVLPFCLARQLEDLRQRMHVLLSLPGPEETAEEGPTGLLDSEYATLIRGRVRMMDQIRAASEHSEDGSERT